MNALDPIVAVSGMSENMVNDYPDSTFMVVSKVAYLIGVPKNIFENEHEPPKMEWYTKLEADKNARIVRNLCMLRTALERNFSKIQTLIVYEMKSLMSMPELVPTDSIMKLSMDGIEIVKANYKPTQELICKGWILPPNTYDCGSFVVNCVAVVRKERRTGAVL